MMRLAWFYCILAVATASAQEISIHHFDVGQGDCIFILGENGRGLLVDCGSTVPYHPDDPGRVADMLATLLDGREYYTLTTHYHSDHIEWIDDIIATLGQPLIAFDRGTSAAQSTAVYNKYVQSVTTPFDVRQVVTLGDLCAQGLDLGSGVSATVVALDGEVIDGTDVSITLRNENNRSIGVLVSYGGFDYLAMGDLSASVERLVGSALSDPSFAHVDVYKVDHHGRATSSTWDFLVDIVPEVSVCSVGKKVTFPSTAVYDRLHAAGSYLYQTCPGFNGPLSYVAPPEGWGVLAENSVVITTDGLTYNVAAAAEPEFWCVDDFVTDDDCPIDLSNEPFTSVAPCLLRGLIVPETGLVRSREIECWTTIYKNALAAMVFLLEGYDSTAETIFRFFDSKRETPFTGFVKDWNPCTGNPLGDNQWVGDNAFLLLALNLYAHENNGSYGAYEELRDALRVWLSSRVPYCHSFGAVAEGSANMYAALAPFGNAALLQELVECFASDVDYGFVLDHTTRGALVFGYTRGFRYLDAFARSETWECTPQEEINAYAAFSDEEHINVEVSAQLLLAWQLWQDHVAVDLASLASELEALRVTAADYPGCAGLPFSVRCKGFRDDYALPIVDATAFLYFAQRGFNPFAPGRRAAAPTDPPRRVNRGGRHQ